jgi:tetratricopeptide (TPR) repeat protein
VLKAEGYETGAVVGAYVLDAKWGLNQGFDFYYDRFELDRKEGFSMADVQRRGDEVVDQALDWLGKSREKPFFLFVHLYDPHTPYDPPSPYGERYGRDPYLGEVAYTDSQVARLLGALRERGLEEKTAVAFTADHGESLGEHGEATHGFFVYQAAIHVPLIVALPGGRFRGLSVPSVVSLTDVMPTLLDLAGAPVPVRVQGRSLVPLFSGTGEDGGERVALSETFYPRFHYGWNDIVSIQDGRHKLILSPGEELYDLAADPGEANDIFKSKPEIARRLSRRLADLKSEIGRNRHQTDYRKMDEATREKLASLGYVGSFVSTDSDGRARLPSPRDKIDVFNKIQQAKELNLSNDVARAEEVMLDVIRLEPEIVDAYFVLGNICFKQQRYRDSIRWLAQALERKPDYDFVVLNMAIAHIELGDLETAERTLADFVGRFSADSILYLTLGDINIKQEDYGQAETYFQECLNLNPTSAAAVNNLARVRILQDRPEEALEFARKARELNPGLKNLSYNFAQACQMLGRDAEAEAEYLAELERHPENHNAGFNLAMLYRQKGDLKAMEAQLLRVKDVEPSFPLSYVFLGELYFQEGARDAEAIALLRESVRLGLDVKHLKLAYYLLAKIHLRRGQNALAAEYAQRIKGLGDAP